MKRIISCILVILLLVPAVVACDIVGKDAVHMVNFYVEGQKYSSVVATNETSLVMPTSPTKEGYDFIGWYYDEGSWKKPFGAESLRGVEITADVNVYAYFVLKQYTNATLRCDKLADVETYRVIPNSTPEVVVDKFTDNKYNYFYFLLGEIKMVPVFCSNINNHNSQNNTLTITNTSEVSSMLQKTTNICITNGVTDTLTENMQVTGGGAFGNNMVAQISGSVSVGFSQSTAVSFNSSVGESVTNAITQSTSSSAANSFTLTSDDIAGKYRFVKFADFEVYAVLVCDIEAQTYYYDYITSVKENSYQEGWYYGATTEEMEVIKDFGVAGNKLAFAESAIDGLDLYGSISDVRVPILYKGVSTTKYEISLAGGGRLYTPDISALYASEIADTCPPTKVRITVIVDVDSGSGDVKVVGRLQSNNKNTLLKETGTVIEGKYTSLTAVKHEMSYGDFKAAFAGDKTLYVSILAEGSHALDFIDNNYDLTYVKVVVEYVY